MSCLPNHHSPARDGDDKISLLEKPSPHFSDLNEYDFPYRSQIVQHNVKTHLAPRKLAKNQDHADNRSNLFFSYVINEVFDIET